MPQKFILYINVVLIIFINWAFSPSPTYYWNN